MDPETREEVRQIYQLVISGQSFEAYKKLRDLLEKTEVDFYEQILDAVGEIGIYPRSVKGGGEIDYEDRTEWMEGWNAAVKHMIKCVIAHRQGQDIPKIPKPEKINDSL